MTGKIIRPAPAEIEFRNMRFLITDQPQVRCGGEVWKCGGLCYRHDAAVHKLILSIYAGSGICKTWHIIIFSKDVNEMVIFIMLKVSTRALTYESPSPTIVKLSKQTCRL